MLDAKYIVENESTVRRMLADRGAEADVDGILELAEKRRKLVYETDEKRAEQNRASEAIAEAKKVGEDTAEAVAEMKALAAEVKELGARLSKVEGELYDKLLEVPNMPHESVPPGETPEDNELVRSWGDAPQFEFPARAHYDLGEMLGVLDVERAARVAGSRFAMTVGAGARLERALLSFFLDEASAAGYTEVFAPFLVNSAAMTGTGQLPKFGFDMYGVDGEDLWLNPTGEVPITNLHAGEILDGDRLPLKYAGYTACFRREAGAHGRDTRGMMRVHQFNKVELVKITDAGTGGNALRRRPGLRRSEDLRRRGLGAERRDLPGDIELHQLRGVPGPPDEHPLQARERRQAAVRPHAERVGPCDRQVRYCRSRKLPERRWVRHDTGGTAAVHGRDGEDRIKTHPGFKRFFITFRPLNGLPSTDAVVVEACGPDLLRVVDVTPVED
jgi:seryl-tRNA synthetase